MENNESKTVIRKTITEFFYILKKNLILIFLMIALAVGGGFAYIKLVKPNYTASENVIYKAEVPVESKTKTTSSVAAMGRYFSTVVDFCTTGKVLDRADFYYERYLYTTYCKNGDVNSFIEDVLSNKVEYTVTNTDRKHYSLDKISVYSLESSKYVIHISIKDSESMIAKDKLRILVLACNEEIENAFAGVTTYIQETVDGNSGLSCVSDISKTKVLIIAAGIGLLLSILIIFLKAKLDNTIKDKEELEILTGSNVLAFIENQEGNNGRKKIGK